MARCRRTALVVGLAVLVAAGCLLVGVRVVRTHATAAPAVPHSVPTTAATASTASPTPTPHQPSTRRILFIGASYTAGLGASTPAAGYASQVAAALGGTADVHGAPGTGFVNPGPTGAGTFGDRMAVISRSPRPALVVFQAGRNDTIYPIAQLRPRVEATLLAARARFRGARLAVVGPIPGVMPIGPNILAVEELLRSVTSAYGIAFIDPIEAHWITGANLTHFTGTVPDHPNDAGYAYIAARLSMALRPLLDPSG